MGIVIPSDGSEGSLDLSVIVVSYNTKELTLACLASVLEETRDVSFEVIVFDNASKDGSAEAIGQRFPEFQLIESPENLGFAGANNRAAQKAKGSHILLLNPDTLILDRAIDKLHAFAKGKDAIVGGRTLFPNRTLNSGSCFGKPTPWSVFCLGVGLASLFRRSAWLNPESLGRWKRDDDRQVDIISGCFMMLHRTLWDKLKGFDLDYFMYGEDFDICLRAKKLGAPSWVCGNAQIVHYAGASEKIRSDKMVRLFTARIQLYRRHWPKRWIPFGILMHDLWALTRYMACTILALVKSKYRVSRSSWKTIWESRRVWRQPENERDAR